MPDFPYVGLALTPAEFADYVAHYDFGTVPPDYVVLHHTADPDASWAPLSDDVRKHWDLGDETRTLEQIKANRLTKLAGVMRYYRDTLGWSAGPHLWIDDRFIYLMTPMYNLGVHAMWGNSFTRDGHLHYSIGIEVVGCYTHVQWPAAVQANVRACVQTLQQRLKTFTLDYMYSDPASKPGCIGSGDSARCAHPERLRFGGLSSHRDYNKPSCPGDAITEAFYLSVVRAPAAPMPTHRVTVARDTPIYEQPAPGNVALGGTAKISAGTSVDVDVTEPNGWLHLASGVGFIPPEALQAPVSDVRNAITADSTIFGTPSATQEQAVAAILARHPDASYTPFDVRLIVSHYFRVCALVGVDPIIAIAQMMHETGTLTAPASLRPRRNPAGIGITGDGVPGVSFPDWGQSVVAQVGRLVAYFTKPGERTAMQQDLIAAALRYRDLPAKIQGSATCIRQLGQVHNPSGSGWAMPGDNYGNKIAEYANAIAGTKA
jgi:hypothetical protein